MVTEPQASDHSLPTRDCGGPENCCGCCMCRCVTECLRRSVPLAQVTVLDKTRADWSEYKVRGRVPTTSLGTGCCRHGTRGWRWVACTAGRHRYRA